MEVGKGDQRWVLIETGGNQRYIFGSNRLRHVLGASHLVREVGMSWVPAAVRALNLPGDTVVMTASGKATLLVDSVEAGQAIVTVVTGRALSEAPGLRVTGVVGEPFDPGAKASYEAALKCGYGRLAEVRAARPDPLTRDRVFPWHQLCRDSGLPAKGEEPYGEDEPAVPASATVLAQSDARESATRRLRDLLGEYSRVVPKHLDTLKHSGWIAIVHADGNGVGGLFREFGKHVAKAEGGGPVPLTRYRQYQREVTEQLDKATEAAVVSGVRALVDAHGRQVDGRFLPIVVGGDDVTVACDAALALPFTRAFSAAFERHTADQRKLSKIAMAATERGHLTASAGIAIVKSHHPFANAYDLAEALTESAKRFKDADGLTLAGVDLHLVHASTRQELKALRKYLPDPDGDGVARHAGPYLLADEATLPADLRHRGIGHLAEITGWLEPGGWLSGAQAHALREAADRSLAEYRHQLALVAGRPNVPAHAARLLDVCEEDPPRLPSDQRRRFLRLFDALCLRGLRLDSAVQPEGGA